MARPLRRLKTHVRSLWMHSPDSNWFNDTYGPNLTRTDLIDLLHVATKGQLFQFDGALYEQTDHQHLAHGVWGMHP